MGVNTLNEFVYFVRFFLMNKSYIFCTLSVITLYNNHTPTPPRPAEAGGIVTSFTVFYDFFWIFFVFLKSAQLLDLFYNLFTHLRFLTFCEIIVFWCFLSLF